MPSSTSLYSSTPGNANVASQNFTTLYSGSGTINPQQAYGNANVVSLLATSTDGGNTIGNISATGNVTADYFIGDGSQLTNITAGNIVGNVGLAQFVTGNAQANITSVGTLTSLSVTGNVTAANFFGNVDAAGSNTQIQFNTGNVLDASANLTFDKATNALEIGGGLNIFTGLPYPGGIKFTANTITANAALGNLVITNGFMGTTPAGSIHINAYELLVGNPNDSYYSNAPIRAVNREALQLTTTGNGAPGIIVGKYDPAFAPMTGNIDVYTSNVGGYGGTGNLNLSGNVYVSRDAQGADATFGKANLIVRDSIFADQGITAIGNIQGNVFSGNGSGLTNINAANIIGGYGNANVANFLGNGFGSNTIVTTGNITAGNVLGNVFTASGNANVIIRQIDAVNQANAVYLDANNVIIGNAGNSSKLVAASTNQLILAVSGSGGPQMYFGPASTGNVDLRSSGSAISGGFAANGNINLSGNVFIGNGASQTAPASTGLNLAVAGTISAAGNITANASSFFIGNGSLLTGIATSSYGNANVSDFLANGFGSNTIVTTGNITAGNINTPNVAILDAGTVIAKSLVSNVAAGTLGLNVISANAYIGGRLHTGLEISAAGNITAPYFIGNGSQLTDIVSTYGNANVANFLGNGFGSNTITTTGNITSGNSTVTNTLYASNIEGAAGQPVTITAEGTGDIHLDADSIRIGDNNTAVTLVTHGTGNLILRTHEGSAVEGNITVVNGVNGNIQLNPNGTGVVTTTAVSASGNVDAGNLRTAGAVSATGNINGANLVASANLTSTQQTIVGTANNGSTGNIVMSGKNIATDMAWNPDGGNALTGPRGRVVVGTGWNGNIAHTGAQSRLAVFDSITRAATTNNVRSFDVDTQISLTGNVTSASFRQQGIGSRLRFGGGSAGNTINIASPTTGALGGTAALQPNIDVGNVSPYNLGNTYISHGTLNGGFFTMFPGGSMGNAYGMLPGALAQSDGNASAVGNITNYIGFTNNLGAAPSVTGNLYVLYHGNVSGSAEQSAVGVAISNAARAAPNYYFLRNDDAVAQVQLGSLRSYNEFRYDTGTSGPITIDKNNAQVQYIAPTANVTISGYANMVTTLSDSVNTDQEIDTLTILVQQGATPYTVTLPTGATYQYAGNISSVPAVANSRSILTVVAANVAGTVNYFTTVQSDQAAASAVAGANTQVQFNDAGVFGATAGLTFDKTSNVMVVAGNINGANLVATANLTSTQQTVVGTANTGTTGNIVMSGRNLATDMAYQPDGATGTTQYLGRVMVGTGWAGNIAVGQPSRLSTMDMINRGNTSTSMRQLESDSIVNLTANVSNSSFRQQAFGARLRVGGGSAGNSTVFGSGVGIPFTIAAAQLNLDIGNQSPYLLGNTSVSHAALNSGALSLNAGSSIGNAYGYVPFVNSAGSGGTANITNYIGMASSFASANVTGNLFCFYNGNATSVGSYSVQTSNNARAATNYYFLRNDDNVAQVQLGSLRSYNEFQYSTATTGTVNIDKNNAQVQFLNPTANVTIGDFQNFVTTANDSVNNDNQSDTVTLIIQQGATPYTVTMPTGNAAIKYLGGTTTVGSTANAVSVVTIQAVRSAANAALYLTAISSEYT